MTTFEALSDVYNLTPDLGRDLLFAQLVAAEAAARPDARALDIGCGTGIGTGAENADRLRLIREAAGELWGVEPDTSINPEHGLLDRLVHATLEEADLPEAHFDVAYGYLVMEHVQHPEAFLAALRRCLKPGGVFIFLTLNSRHYFTRLAKLSKQARIDEKLLRLLRPTEVDDYHYPVVYRFNDPRKIDAMGKAGGFPKNDFVFQETSSPAPYFPGPMRPLMHVLDGARRKRPESLLNLIGRMQREG